MKKSFLIFSLFSFIFSLGITFSYSSEDVSNANYLADQKIVTKQTVASKYRLDDKILRQEVIAMALKIKGITLPENYKCKKYFADVISSNDWVCRAIEIAADNGIITRSNKYANPGKYVTRAEALAMVMKAGNIDRSPFAGHSYYFDGNLFEDGSSIGYKNAYKFGATWQASIFYDYIRLVLENDALLKQDPRANDLAKRSEVFVFTKNIMPPSMEDIYPFINMQFYLDNQKNKVFYTNEEIGIESSTKYLLSYVKKGSSLTRFGAVEEINIYCEVPSPDRCGIISVLPADTVYTMKAYEKSVTIKLAGSVYTIIYDKPLQIIDTEKFFDFLGMPYGV